MTAEQVADGVFRLRLGRTNAYLVSRDQSAVLVDTGLPIHADGILRVLARLGLQPDAVQMILLTHRHLDHSGSAHVLSERCGARVVIHRADAAAVQGHERLSPTRGLWGLPLAPLVALTDTRIFRFQPCAVEPVEEGWQHDDFSLVHLPGHTPGHSGYLYRPADVVFCGDAANNPSGRLSHPSRVFSLDPLQVRRSQQRLAQLDADLYCFGHGSPLHRGSAALLSLSRR